MTDEVPFYDEFNDRFPRIANPNLAFGLKSQQPCMSVGTTNRNDQLLTSQLLAKINVRRFNLGIYQQLTMNKPIDTKNLNLDNILNTVRAVIGTSTDTRFGEVGVGLILQGKILVDIMDRVVKPENVGVYLSNRTENSTFDVQVLQKGCTLNMTTMIADDVYLGSSYSNLMDDGGHYESIFISRLPKVINPDLSFVDNLTLNSKFLVGINMMANRGTIIGQTSTPFQTRFGDATVMTGTSIDTVDKNKSTVTLSGKHTLGETGLSLLGSIDLSPIKRKLDAGMLGLEYSPTRMPKLGNIGLYGEITNSSNGIEFTPKFGINLKF